MENCYKYFQNSDCEYFPCHTVMTDPDNFSCLFCYCPLYRDHDCPGYPDFSHGIKDCSNCDYPHKAENYYNVVDFLVKKTVERKEER
jgi:Zn-finger protein